MFLGLRSAVLSAGLTLALHAVAEPAVPTVIVDIHAQGYAQVQRLGGDPEVRWSAEFGNELLLGVAPAHLEKWLAKRGVRIGFGELAPDEVLVRDHVCSHQAEAMPALGVVGGYEIVRLAPDKVLTVHLSGLLGRALPSNGVFAREVANEPVQAQTQAADPEVASVVARVDAERWFASMSTLSTFNRNSFSPMLGSAREWVLGQFADAGLSTQSFPFELSNLSNCGTPAPAAIQLANPIGTKRGLGTPDEWVVVGAHYDSRNSARCDGVNAPQPGANDNASGCAGVIELARAMRGVPTARSILFMCFAGEEQGLVGSRRYVEALQANGDIAKVKHMINLDMLGYANSDALAARVETNTTHQNLLSKYAAAAATYAPELGLITSANASGGSDHFYFLGAGVPAVFTWQNGASVYPHYHQQTDIPSNMTRARPLAGGILKMDAAMLTDQAGLLGPFADGFE